MAEEPAAELGEDAAILPGIGSSSESDLEVRFRSEGGVGDGRDATLGQAPMLSKRARTEEAENRRTVRLLCCVEH